MALKGIKVIEFSGLAPGPFCGKILRDLGARVIRVDRSGFNATVDRLSHDKESISINLKNKKGIEIVKNLTKTADVLIDPYRKGVLERLDLGPKSLFAVNPGLIYARLTGYGQFGELSERAGHDINYISYSGVLSTFGRQHENPYAPINIVADFGGGGLMCALAIMTSLYERKTKNTTNKVIDLSMVEGSAYLSSWLWTSQDIPGVWEGTTRGASLLDGGYPAYDTYKTKDGKFMACGSLEPQFYQELITKLGLQNSGEITKDTLDEIFITKTQSEWVDVFKNSDACVSPVLTLQEAPNHPHNKERESFVHLKDNNHLPDMNWLGLTKSSRNFKMPKVGQDTIAILKDIGYKDAEIQEMLKEEIVQKETLESKL